MLKIRYAVFCAIYTKIPKLKQKNSQQFHEFKNSLSILFQICGNSVLVYVLQFTLFTLISYLVIMARSLTIFSEALQSLVDQREIRLVDVKSEQTEPSSRAAADAVQELQRLAHQIVIRLVILSS